MVMKLLDNMKTLLGGLPVRHSHECLDSIVALHWISGCGDYKQFENNRVKLIREKSYITWNHVRTRENLTDVGSRGSLADHLPAKWLNGLKRLFNPGEWPTEVPLKATEETGSSAKQTQKIFKAVRQKEGNNFPKIRIKHTFWKSMRVTAWVAKFFHNARTDEAHRPHGPLITD